ncbi:MAG: hypothetical protein M3340_11140 [Actinomycetota bacterium]|nr:hypothetical protein [Actinomycetota bacterium]
MGLITRPNAWVAVEDDPQTQLTYAPRVDPAPLTVSVPGRDPTLGSLVVVITNQTANDLAVESVTLTIIVGTPGVEGAPLTPTTADVKTAVSDEATWAFAGPAQPVTSGTADFVLGPQAGNSATLAAGASVVVEIYDFQTTPAPGTSTVTITEALADTAPAFTEIAVSTFPDGFYFDSLTVNVLEGSELVPAAQVTNGTGVTLTWNSSLVDTAEQTVYWSSATAGQQQATPSKLGEWSTPANAPLTSDTVFVVIVVADGVGGEQLSASLATSVSVQNPALVASTITTGDLAVTADETVGGTLTATGALTANGGLTASAAAVSGNVQAGSLAAGTATVSGSLNAQDAAVTLLGRVSAVTAGTYQANTDGFLIANVPMTGPTNMGLTLLTATCAGVTATALGGASQIEGVQGWLPYSASLVLPVPAGQQITLSTPGTGNLGLYDAWFVPLGTPPKNAAALDRTGDAPPPGGEADVGPR